MFYYFCYRSKLQNFDSKIKNTPITHIFMVLNETLSHNFREHILGFFFFHFSHHSCSAFFCTLTSLNSISEPINQVCVLGAINDSYEALCNVCMCQKVSVNYGQQVRFFFFFHKTEWVKMIFSILNLEGHQNCMIGSRVKQF